MKANQVLLALLCVVLISSCAQTRQARSVEKTGFLEDYSILKEGGEGEARCIGVYPNPRELRIKRVGVVNLTKIPLLAHNSPGGNPLVS